MHIKSNLLKEKIMYYSYVGLIVSIFLYYIATMEVVLDFKNIIFILLAVSIAFVSSIAFSLEYICFESFIFVFMVASLLLFHPRLGFLLYSEKTMYVFFNLQFILNLIIFWWIKLNNLLSDEKYINELRVPFVLLIFGSTLSMVHVLDFRVFLLWMGWNIFLFAISENTAYIIHKVTKQEYYNGIYKLYVIVLFVLSIPLVASLVIKGYGRTVSMLVPRAKGVFTSPNSLGVLSAVSIFWWLGYYIYNKSVYKKILAVVLIIVGIYLIYSSVSRNALLSLIVGLGIFVFSMFSKTIRRKYVIISAVISVIIVAIIFMLVLKYARGFTERLSTALSGKEVSTLLRILMAKYTTEFLLHNPFRSIIGNGYYQFYYYKFSFGLEKPHILLLDWWFSFGILGIVAFFMLFYYTFVKPLIFVFNNRDIMSKKEYLFRSAILTSLAIFWLSTLFDEVFWVPHHPILIGLVVPYLIISTRLIIIRSVY